MSRVEICKVDGYTEVEDVLKKILPTFSSFNKLSGKRVLLKINLLTYAKPEYAVTTHPEFVRALIRVFKSINCVVSVGDGPSEAGRSFLEKVYRDSGIKKVCCEENVPLIDFIESIDIKNNENKVGKIIPVAKAIKEVDYIVNVPKLKTHGLTYITCGVKNLFGVIPGVKKSEYHLRLKTLPNFSAFLVDVASTIKPVITIVDGVLSMEGDGPRNGKARLTNLILLSEDVFSLDWVASEIIGLKPILVPTNKEAYVRGLVKPENIEITGIPLKIAIIKDLEMIHKPVTPLPLPTVVNSFLENYIAGKPYFDDNLCNKCLTCVKNCPAKALKKVNGKIEINRKNCIKCYCCAEFCPNGAVKIKYSWLSRWLRTKIK